jgi:hypothetical protein
MNECWRPRNDYRALHDDLAAGRNGAWQLGAFHGPNGYYQVDRETFRVSLNPRTRLIREYLRYVRPGARRIGATATDEIFAPLAFIGADGKYTVIVKADRGGGLSVANLPAGTYGVSYALTTGVDRELEDLTVAEGQALVTRIPASGVISIHRK